jgi:2-C-methyl-D-erythritol 4-phosphate cytidylyltransferase
VAAATDDAMLVEEAGGKVVIHPSPAENLKVTTAADRRLAELLLAERC